MSKLRCVVLDDYQGVATGLGDFGRLADRVETTVEREHVADTNALVALLADAAIVVVMRERTPLSAAVLARLPHLRLVVTSGMRNASIDLEAARQRGVVVSGTASASDPPVELTWALLLAHHAPVLQSDERRPRERRGRRRDREEPRERVCPRRLRGLAGATLRRCAAAHRVANHSPRMVPLVSSTTL